jgi:bacteriorhodopsin
METVWLTLGTFGMGLGTVAFVLLGIRAPEGSRYFFVITALITLIAFVSYLTMATGQGVTEVGDRTFYYFRYIDWVFTTPLLLLDLALLALVDWRRNISLIVTLIGLDLFMILTGLWAGATVNPVGMGLLFIISTASMIVLLYLIVTRLFSAAADQPSAVQQVFRTLAVVTVVLWSLYPVVWVLGTEGVGAVGLSTEVFLFLVLDLLAKVGFGFLLLTNRQALSDVAGAAAGTARPSRVV